jgi:hypothetical protein
MAKGPSALFAEFDCEAIDPAEVDLSECHNTVIVSVHGHVQFIWGRYEVNRAPFYRDVYPLLRHPSSPEERGSLVELVRGKICRSRGVLAPVNRPTKVKVLHDYVVRLPDGGAMRGFSVERRETCEMHVALTRAVFGLCMEEYDHLIYHFNSCFRHESREGRLTAANSRDNLCTLTRRWIPARFPYIALAESGYYGGHVSLAGFLELFTFLCPHRTRDRSYQMLVESGVSPDLLELAIGNLFAGRSVSEIYGADD